MRSRIFTMRKRCPACGCTFTISSAASVYCQNRDCKRKRRRDDYAARKARATDPHPQGFRPYPP